MLQKGAFCNISTFIKLQFVIKIFVLSIFEWPFYTGFTVHDFYLQKATGGKITLHTDTPPEMIIVHYASTVDDKR